MAQLADIIIIAMLPLHPRLAAVPRLSIQLLDRGNMIEEIDAVTQDQDGAWESTSVLKLPDGGQPLSLAVVIDGQENKTSLLSSTFDTTTLRAQVEAQSDVLEYRDFIAYNSLNQIRVSIWYRLEISPPETFSGGRHSQNLSDIKSPTLKMPSKQEALEEEYVDYTRLPNSDKEVDALNSRGYVHYQLYEQSLDLTHLDHSVSLHREAIRLGHSHPRRALYLAELGSVLEARYNYSGNRADIDEAIQVCQNALSLTQRDSPGLPERTELLMHLALKYDFRFKRLGDVGDIDTAISMYSEALALMPEGSPNKAKGHNNFATALLERFRRLGVMEDLDRAIPNLENAISITPYGHPERPRRHNNLGGAFYLRFECLGALSDLEMAIINQEKAVQLTPDGHPQKPLYYSNFGLSLQSRFERLGVLSDLERAITNKENAWKLTPDGHPEKPRYYSTLGSALLSRFERLGDLADLERAIANFENTVRLTPDGHPSKPERYHFLGNAFRCRFERLGDLADLETAITHTENSMKLTPDGHPSKRLYYNSLGGFFIYRFKRLGDLADLERAITDLENAMRLTPDGDPGKVDMISNLASSHLARFDSSARKSDLELAHSLYATAAQSPVGDPRQRVKAASTWSHCAKLMNNSPLPAFKCIIDLLPRIAWLGIPVSEQHSLLEKMGGAVQEAVAAAIEMEEYNMAMEWVEQGRSIVWQNLLKLRTPLDDLRAVHPGLATRLQLISQRLASHDFMPQTPLDRPQEEVVTSHTQLAIEWDELVDKIRSLSNFKTFLKPKEFVYLVPAAREGPVIILNVAQGRCDALALVSDGNGATTTVHIPLENLSLHKSAELLIRMTKLLESSGVRDGDMRASRRVGSKANPNMIFKSILRTLWVDVVKPVMDGLAYQPRTSDLPRIWWCTTGPLTFLPVHAAGDYDKTEVGHKLSDFVVSSYTPTLTAILDSSYPSPSKDFKLLTVAQPSGPGLSEIPKTMDEVEQIAKVATNVSVVSLAKEEATLKRVQKGMRESNWVHLACHGKQDAAKPMDSGLILYDGTLKLSEIVKENLLNAEFAFLSACQTAMGDESVEEESVHLAAGMLLAGYKGVIATMWSIRDEDGPRVAEVVYSRMLKDGKPNRREAAYALHDAVKQLRESGADFTSWVPFIHIGR